ncbi:MAG: hypothetical protein RDU20_03365 [Desulfomonilaceae bacterium]|nr:hypothetical protein [Desulfomonilaceae bacterium]
MRTRVNVALLGCFLVLLLAVATAPAMADEKVGPKLEHSGITGQDAGEKAVEGKTEFSGEAREGVREDKPEKQREMKSGIKGKVDVEASTDPAAKVRSEEKEKMRGETGIEQETKGEAEMEQELKPEARSSSEEAVTGQAEGGRAIVARIDRPENCLRVRSGPGTSYDIIGCASKGDTLVLTGTFSEEGRWAQLDNNGWVFFDQLETDVARPQVMASEGAFDQPAAAGDRPRKGFNRFHGYGGYYHTPGYWSYGCPGYGYYYGYPRSSMYWYHY